MASLTAQMEELKKQQAILAEKIRQEEETVRKQQFTIEKLEKLNIQQKENIKNYKSKDGKYKGKYELQLANLMTVPRFEVILEILKKQDARIEQLEKGNEVDNTHLKRASTIEFSDLQMMKRY
tara:strand:+ start:318 stop:686 length:369 start_codon:yes stop_codon:yes gene_type:complete